MADNVEVKIVGDGGPVKASMQDTSTSVQASLEGIRRALENFGSKNREVVDKAVQNNANLSRSFLELKASATGGFNAIAGVIERFRGVLGTLTAALAGGMIGKESVAAMIELRDTVRGLQIVFGVTSEKATEMAVQFKLAGISAAAFEAMAFKVGRQLKSQGGEFDRLGVKTKDAAGNFLPMDEILQNVYRRMLDFKPGTDQMEFALSTVGRSAKDFASDMTAMNAVTERTKAMMEELGIEMGAARQAEIGRYKIEVRAFGVILDEIGVRIGEVLLPGLMRLAQWFNSVGPEAIAAAVTAVKGLATGFEVLAQAGYILYTALKILVAVNVAVYEGMANVAKALKSADFMGAARAAQAAWEQMKRDTKAAVADLVKFNEDGVKRINALWGNVNPEYWGGEAKRGMKSPMTGKGNLNWTPPKTGGGIVSEWREQLEQLKDAQGFFNEFSKAMEAQFWADKLTQVKAGTKQYRAVYHLMHEALRADAHEQLANTMATFQLEIDAAKESKDKQISIAVARTATIKAIFGEESKEYKRALDEELKIRQEWVKKEQDIMRIRTKMAEAQATHEISMEQLSVDQAVSLRQISNEQKFAIEQGLEDRLYALKVDALQKEQALLQAGTKEYIAVAAKIEEVEQQHQLKITQIANQAELERKQFALQASQDIQNNFANFFGDLANRTTSLREKFAALFRGIASDLNKLAGQQLAKQLFGAGTGGGDFLNKVTGGIFGGGNAGAASGEAAHTAAVTADTTATTAQTTTTVTLTTSSSVLATSFAALASAAQTASAALAAVGGGGFGGGGFGDLFGGLSGGDFIPSFDVGTAYVPQDSLAYVHKGEAIVPAKYNKGGTAGAFHMNVHNHFTISGPVDTRTQGQIAEAAGQSIKKAASPRSR